MKGEGEAVGRELTASPSCGVRWTCRGEGKAREEGLVVWDHQRQYGGMGGRLSSPLNWSDAAQKY